MKPFLSPEIPAEREALANTAKDLGYVRTSDVPLQRHPISIDKLSKSFG